MLGPYNVLQLSQSRIYQDTMVNGHVLYCEISRSPIDSSTVHTVHIFRANVDRSDPGAGAGLGN